MKRNQNKVNNGKNDNGNGLIPNSFRFISSYLRSAGASVSGDSSDQLRKDQVLCCCFDRLELSPSIVKHVLLLGYSNGFQVLDVDDGSSFNELVSSRDDPVTFLQIQPTPEQTKSHDHEGFKMSHPLLLVVASEETRVSGSNIEKDESQIESSMFSPTTVRFYSLRSHSYVHVLRFRSTVYTVRCSPRIVAVGLASQIYCFDALTLENKFSVLTYPISQLGGNGINIGYGPMGVGPRWLAYASNNPLVSNTGRLSPQNLSPSPGVSPSTSPGGGSLMARYASKQLANGLINLGDMSYRSLSKYCHDLLPDGSGSPSRTENSNAGMVVIKDFVSKAVVSQFRAHTSPISALSFDPSGTLLVTASVHGNNINIFRILPCTHTHTHTQNFNWSCSHVHLYKLHRGMTSAVIQDFCFSQYSQWIAVVSSRGTCHIFLLSPFGGQLLNSKLNLSACVSAPITLSVVSRIKNVSFGWINNTVSGKTPVPAGVIAATFHSCVVSNVEALEHLLVYAPSGYVIQYELLPCLGREQGEKDEEDMRAKVEPVQWWDVCRRTDWPEKEEFVISGDSGYENNKDLSKQDERSRWFLSKAEVRMRSGRVPVWQKSKIYFYVMAPQLCEAEAEAQGEVDIETIPVNEVEIKHKDLLPVFDSSLGWTDSRYPPASSPSNIDGKFHQDSTVSLSSSVTADDDILKNLEQTFNPPIVGSSVNNNNIINSPSPGVTIGKSSDSIVTSDTSNPSSNRSDLDMNIVDEEDIERNKFEEDGDSDDMLGGVFAFSEES